MKNDYDKVNDEVGFIEKTHVYKNLKDPDKKYTSVTTLIEKFAQPFDKKFWSAYKSLEKLLPSDNWKIEKKSLLKSKKFNKEILDVYNISENDFNKAQQDILDEWQKKNEESCIRGTAIHADLEKAMYSNPNTQMKKFGFGGKFKAYKDKNKDELTDGVYPEYLVYYTDPDNVINIAGQIDLLSINDGKIEIGDYKTSLKIDLKGGFNTETKSTYKMLYPLNNLDECNFSHYSLQLSLYAWMINRWHPEWSVGNLKLIHFDHTNKMTIYDVPYLKTEVEKMLKYFKKETILARQRAKRKPIIY